MSVAVAAKPASTAVRSRPDPSSPEIAQLYAVLAARPPRGQGGRMAQTLPSALEALRSNKGRAVLTALGIIIGVAAVIVMVALGQGANAKVANQLSALGTNVLTITPGSARSGGAQTGAGGVN